MADKRLNVIKEMYDVVLFIPDFKEYLGFSEGTGDNLLSEDKEEGYIDYIDYTQYSEDCKEKDGGMYMLKEYFSEKYPVAEFAADELIEYIYGDKHPYAIKKGFFG